MNVTALVIIAVCTGLFLVGVLAEPWQRPRYDEALDKAHSLFDQDGHVSDAALEAFIADEFLHEASDG